LILWRALLATPLHLTRCRKTFFTADHLASGPAGRREGRSHIKLISLPNGGTGKCLGWHFSVARDITARAFVTAELGRRNVHARASRQTQHKIRTECL